MSAAAVLSGLLGAGVTVEGGADRVRLVEPRPGLLRPEHGPAVRALKPALARLATGGWRLDLAGWPAWRLEAFEERAAIREYDGQQPRDLAERCAYLEAAELPEPVDDPDLDTQLEGAADIEATPAGTSTTEPPPDPGPPAALAGAELPDLDQPPADPKLDPELEAPVGFVARPPALPPTAPLPPFRWGSVVPLALDPPRAPHRWPHPLGDGPPPGPSAYPRGPEAKGLLQFRVPLPPRVDREGHLSAIEAASVAQLGPVRGRAPLAPPSPDVSPEAARAWRAAYQRRRDAGLDVETAERLTNTTHGPRPA